MHHGSMCLPPLNYAKNDKKTCFITVMSIIKISKNILKAKHLNAFSLIPPCIL